MRINVVQGVRARSFIRAALGNIEQYASLVDYLFLNQLLDSLITTAKAGHGPAMYRYSISY